MPVRLSGPELVVDVVDFGDEGVAAGGPLDRLTIELVELVAKVVLASGQLGSPRADHSTAQWGEVAFGADRRHGGRLLGRTLWGAAGRSAPTSLRVSRQRRLPLFYQHPVTKKPWPAGRAPPPTHRHPNHHAVVGVESTSNRRLLEGRCLGGVAPQNVEYPARTSAQWRSGRTIGWSDGGRGTDD